MKVDTATTTTTSDAPDVVLQFAPAAFPNDLLAEREFPGAAIYLHTPRRALSCASAGLGRPGIA